MSPGRGRAGIVGSGVVGLHAAAELTRGGFAVTVVSATSDPAAVTPLQVSRAAAGLVEPVATAPEDEVVVTELFTESYAVWLTRAADRALGVDRRRVRYRGDPTTGLPRWIDAMVGATHYADGTAGFDSAVVTPPLFLSEFRRRLVDAGVQFVTHRVEHLAELADGSFDVVVNASGPGAWRLGDPAMYGRRGVLVWARRPTGLDTVEFDAASFSYGIPQRDLLALGGTADPAYGDPAGWDRHARVSDVVRILAAAARLYPDLDVEALDVVDVTCNYRPSRTRLRIEAELTRGVPVVHLTGFGGSGWTLAPAAARRALALIEAVRVAKSA
jgi:glycine/D-amino acid oxidase-like deaminating enzyme